VSSGRLAKKNRKIGTFEWEKQEKNGISNSSFMGIDSLLTARTLKKKKSPFLLMIF
jgi:hypothetical protein